MTTTPKTPLLKTADGKNYLFPFILVTSLFFLWGFAHSLLDVLNKHFQEILQVSRAYSGLVQATVYGGYFLMALPAGLFMKRYGYKKGIIFGLLLYAAGAFLFYPATFIQTFWSFLVALFVIACGLTCLETAGNPYVTVLGPPGSAESRINFSQSFNGLGWIVGPLTGSLLIFGGGSDGSNKFSSLALPYVGVGVVVLLVAGFFFRTKLPEIREETSGPGNPITTGPLFAQRHFVLAVIAQFFYVAAQTGINSFFVNYVTETIPGISNRTAGLILSFGGMGLFMAGRFSGSFIMRYFKPNRILSIYAIACITMMLLVVAGLGWTSVITLFVTYFFMSIMFPTIFALGLKGLGAHTKKASAFIVMAIVGGAICPPLMGYIADISTMQLGFIIPTVCFFFVLYYGLAGYRPKNEATNSAS